LEHGPAVRVDDVLYHYREHGRSMTATIPDQVRRASERVVARWVGRHGGVPSTAMLGSDPAVWFRLGTRLLQSPFAPPRLAVDALHRAQEFAPQDGRVLVQLTVALARAGAVADAARLAVRFAEAEDAGLRRLAATLARLAAGDRSVAVDQLPVLPADVPVVV
jgi:hypothetical protein